MTDSTSPATVAARAPQGVGERAWLLIGSSARLRLVPSGHAAKDIVAEITLVEPKQPACGHTLLSAYRSQQGKIVMEEWQLTHRQQEAGRALLEVSRRVVTKFGHASRLEGALDHKGNARRLRHVVHSMAAIELSAPQGTSLIEQFDMSLESLAEDLAADLQRATHNLYAAAVSKDNELAPLVVDVSNILVDIAVADRTGRAAAAVAIARAQAVEAKQLLLTKMTSAQTGELASLNRNAATAAKTEAAKQAIMRRLVPPAIVSQAWAATPPPFWGHKPIASSLLHGSLLAFASFIGPPFVSAVSNRTTGVVLSTLDRVLIASSVLLLMGALLSPR